MHVVQALTDGGGNKSFMENLADIVERQFDATTSKLGNILLTATGVTALANLAGSGAGLDGGRLALGPAWQQQHKPDPAQMAKDSKVNQQHDSWPCVVVANYYIPESVRCHTHSLGSWQ